MDQNLYKSKILYMYTGHLCCRTCNFNVHVAIQQKILCLQIPVDNFAVVTIFHRWQDLPELPPGLHLTQSAVLRQVVCSQIERYIVRIVISNDCAGFYKHKQKYLTNQFTLCCWICSPSNLLFFCFFMKRRQAANSRLWMCYITAYFVQSEQDTVIFFYPVPLHAGQHECTVLLQL